ncbi:MAG TPA: NADP-dependent oxidoreductase [Desulfobacteraceae bacterium]|nr:NADP-dependent oxidoreductase [Desulfobacteraceae bacterium]
MKAVRIHSFGGPEMLKYEDAPRPIPNDDDVLIRVFAAGVNPVDWKIRQGYMQDMISLPLIPGWDVAGVIEEKGPGVTNLEIGDSVYSRPSIFRNGAYAEYIAVKASEVALKPESIDFLQAAAVPLAGLTAWQSLFDLAHLQAGQKILIHAAAGGVGHFAVQFARWIGAHVIGTSSAHNHDFLKSIGAHETIDYTTTAFEDAVHDADVVLETMGGEVWQRSWKALKKGGIMVSTLRGPEAGGTEALNKLCAHVFVQPDAAQLGEIAILIDSGHVRPEIERIFPLQEADKAHLHNQEGHTRGKIVLEVARG